MKKRDAGHHTDARTAAECVRAYHERRRHPRRKPSTTEAGMGCSRALPWHRIELAIARTFFERLWHHDQVVFDSSRCSHATLGGVSSSRLDKVLA